MSNDKPVIAVVGGVSRQGRSVVNSLLESGRYEVRALTSRMESTEAKRLEQRGAKLQFAPLGGAVRRTTWRRLPELTARSW